MRLLLIGMTTLMLAACGGPREAANNATPNEAAAVENAANAVNEAANAVNYVAAIGNMGETERQATFLRAIRDANISCRDVIKVEQLEPENGVPTWRAQCDQGGQHLIQVQPDGSAKVISRNDEPPARY